MLFKSYFCYLQFWFLKIFDPARTQIRVQFKFQEQTYFLFKKNIENLLLGRLIFNERYTFPKESNFWILDDVLFFRNQPNAIADILQWANGDRQVHISAVIIIVYVRIIYIGIVDLCWRSTFHILHFLEGSLLRRFWRDLL